MYEFFLKLLSDDGFPPRWHCGSWSEFHGWLYIASDLGVWSAYTAIPAVLIYFVWRNKSIPFNGIFLLFGAFILACGLTHLLDAVMFWWPAYRLLGLVELLTAIVSWATVVALVPLVPKALAMRSPHELQREIDARTRAETDLQRVNHELERRIAERTAELVGANATLSEQRELFRTTLASIGDAVISTDTSGRVAFFNPVAESLTGWSASEASGKPLTEVFRIVHETTRKVADNPALRALKEGKVVGLANHTVLIQKSGRELPIDDSAAPIRDERGRLTGVVLVFRDVTQRRSTELALRKSEEQLRAADRSKDEFLAMLAHELRNPLAAIRNALALFKAGGDTQTLAWCQEVMQRQVEHIVRMVDDLLDVSRVMQGKIQLRQEPVDAAAIVQHALEEIRPDFAAQNQQLSFSVPPQPVWVNADPVRLAQIVANLLSNATKYTDAGGSVSVSVRNENDDVIIDVADSGVGIPPNMLSEIFTPFTQIGHSLDRTRGGLGIGLALVRDLVALHGGQVTATSEGIGRGSEFAVRLPRLEAPAPAPTPEWQPSGVPVKRVLVVDDNHDAALSLKLLLSKLWNHEVEVAHDGPTAIEKVRESKPDVVLLDIGLPGLDGYQTARRIRELPDGNAPLLVALTGYGQESDRQKSDAAGFDMHLVKPASVEMLEQVFSSPKRRPS
ncbi:MAG TPA: ATP-binding protein [Pirellulales bacterium]|jgi:PAS domain S-box-containing protein